MVRQKPRKSVEELYGTKFDTSPIKGHFSTNLNTAKTSRNEANYIISSTAGYGTGANLAAANNNCLTSRRKTARPIGNKVEKFPKDDRIFGSEETKKDHTAKKTARQGPGYSNLNSLNSNSADNKNISTFIDNKNKDTHHYYNTSASADDDKEDDDTQEFFQMIRQTVETAVSKSFMDALNRNFRELGSKIDRYSVELKNTNALLGKLQTEVSNKVVHYGEENSRHFRYLCMKSEYDKMFYQHHTMMANSGAPPSAAASEKRAALSKGNSNHDKVSNACKCRNANQAQKVLNVEPNKTSSEERSLSNKSSEMGMREVLEQIQRFCTQMQLNDGKGDERTPKKPLTYRTGSKLKLKQQFDDDDDDFQLSSDGMTPRSEQHTVKNFESGSKRGCVTARNHPSNGAGDA